MPKVVNTPLGNSLKSASGSSRGKSKVLVAATVLLPMSLISMVLANSITINPNSGNSIEFGQGAASTSVCEANMTTEMTSSYDLDSGTFILETVIISGQSAPNNLGAVCADRIITVIPVDTDAPALLATMRATPSATDEVSYTMTPGPATTVTASDIDRILVQTE